MPTTIGQHELRRDVGMILRRVEQGEMFTITRYGAAIADLVPHDSATDVLRTRFLPVKAIAAGLAVLPPWGVEQFADELRELEPAVIDRDLDQGTVR